MTYTRSQQILEVEVGGMPILMHATNWEYMEFNAASAAIWRLLERPQTLDTLVEQLTKQFRVDEAVCRKETALLLEKLTLSEYLVTSP